MSQPLKLVYIEWRDHASVEGAWNPVKDVIGISPVIAHSIGWIIFDSNPEDEDAGHYVLASCMADEAVGSASIILKETILLKTEIPSEEEFEKVGH